MVAKLSKALNNIISTRPPRTERLLSLFLFLVISITSIVMLSVMSAGLESDLNDYYLRSNTQKAINLTDQVDRFLKSRVLQLQGQAQHSVLRQTVMQPDRKTGLLRDFLSTQTILGNSYPQRLYDFKGDILFDSASDNIEHRSLMANLDTDERFADEYERLSDIYSGSQSFSIAITPDQSFWEIALPIRYGAAVEGLLITYIPLLEMVYELNLNKTLDVSIRAKTSNGESIAWGLGQVVWDWTRVPVKETGIEMAYAIDMSSVADSFSDARNRLALTTLIIAFIAIGCAIFIGRWFFVRPIEELQEIATELSDGADPHFVEGKSMTVEVQELHDRILRMAKKISRREQSLMSANETLRNNQDTLVHAEKMAGLGQVTAGVAHEINNPIGFIMNNLTVLNEYHVFLDTLLSSFMSLREELPEEARKVVEAHLIAIEKALEKEDLQFVLDDLACLTEESLQGAKRVRDITMALKGYSYAGESSSLVNINQEIEATLKMVWNELKYNCTIHKHLAPDLPELECIGGQINQVFMNLFINAAHAMQGKSGEITITTQHTDKYVEVIIEDNGCGIPEENLKHIFEPFFTTKGVGEGTGLGMSICYDIVKKHGGEITVDSEVGVGTVFRIRLPIDFDHGSDSQNAN